MTSGKEHYSWRRDAVLPCESAPGLIWEVLETEPACEKATLHVPDHASWDVEAKDGRLDGLRSPFTNCSIVSYSINRLTGTDGFRVLCHQFVPSSLFRLATCISRFKTCSLTVKPLTPAPSDGWQTASRAKTTQIRSSH